MFALIRTKGFKRDVKRFLRNGGGAERLEAALLALQTGTMPPWLRDHQLQGPLRQYRELHVEPDWLLVYEKDGKILRITCLRLVTHKGLREWGRKQ